MANYTQYKHFDKDMERAILGACFLEKGAVGRIYGVIKPEHFYEDANKLICERIFEMWNLGFPIDIFTTAQTLNQEKWTKITSDDIATYLCRMTNAVVGTAHLETHCLMIRQLFANRRALEIKAGIDTTEDGIEALSGLKSQIEDIFRLTTTDDWQSIDEVLINQLIPHMDKVKNLEILGMKSGFSTLDKMTGGFQGGQLIVIGARPSVGKSAFAGVIANTAAKQGKSVGIITLEMPDEQLGARLVSLESDIAFWRIWRNRLSEQDSEKVFRHMSDMSQMKVYFSDQSGVSIMGIRAKAEKLKHRNGLDLLIIDYLQLIDGDGTKSGTREREVAKMSLASKRMAMELDIPIVLLAQLNRGSEMGGEKKPRLHNLRESGAIEQDADIVVMLHRDKLEEQSLKTQGNYGPYDAALIIEKNRNGACGEIPIKFDDEKMRFFEDSIYTLSMPLSNDNSTDSNEDLF